MSPQCSLRGLPPKPHVHQCLYIPGAGLICSSSSPLSRAATSSGGGCKVSTCSPHGPPPCGSRSIDGCLAWRGCLHLCLYKGQEERPTKLPDGAREAHSRQGQGGPGVEHAPQQPTRSGPRGAQPPGPRQQHGAQVCQGLVRKTNAQNSYSLWVKARHGAWVLGASGGREGNGWGLPSRKRRRERIKSIPRTGQRTLHDQYPKGNSRK